MESIGSPVAVVAIEIPGDPIGKGRPRFVYGTGLVYTPKETRLRERHIAATVREAYPDLRPDGDTAFGLCAVFYHGTRQRKDCDNLLKLVADALTGTIWKDDSQVLTMLGTRFYDKVYPRTRIDVIKLDRPLIRPPQKGGPHGSIRKAAGPAGQAEPVRAETQEGKVTK